MLTIFYSVRSLSFFQKYLLMKMMQDFIKNVITSAFSMKIYNKFLLLILVIAPYSQLSSQSSSQFKQLTCGNTYFKQKLNEEIGYEKYTQKHEKQRFSSQITTLPIVVHIIHRANPLSQDNFWTSNPLDARIVEGINQLNQGFGNYGIFNQITDHSHPAANNVDMGIRFCLAKRDISGNPTNGIYRYESDFYTDIDLSEFDDVESWVRSMNNNIFPNSDYINIYLFWKLSYDGNGIGGIAESIQSGGKVAIKSLQFGQPQPDHRFRAPLICHELGHYFGLLHPDQGGCKNDNCLSDNDRVCDTPPSADRECYQGNLNTCSTDDNDETANNPFSSDVDDLEENFMYFGAHGECLNNFTNGQKTRAHYFLDTYGSDLKNSLGCLAATNCTYTDFGTDTDGKAEAECLCSLDYLDDDGQANPNDLILRQDLAKLAYLALYDSDVNSPAHYFPSPYEDLSDNPTSYQKYAKALLYLEYGDGISPFTREFTHFKPTENIEKRYALKVILEAFNIPINTSTNGGTIQQVPFGDPSYEYVYTAASLGIIQNTNTIDARQNVSRRDVFIMLKRVLNIQNSCTPTPSCNSCNANPSAPSDSDYFFPGNLKLKYLSRSPGISEGYMDFYKQTPYNIPSIGFNLSFSFGYNNFWLELPEHLQKNAANGKRMDA